MYLYPILVSPGKETYFASAPSTAWSLHGVPLQLLRVAASHLRNSHA